MNASSTRGAPARMLRSGLAAGVLAAMVGTVAGCSSGSSATPADPDRESAAYAVCHTSVKAKLGTTGDATFSNETAQSTNFGYKISGSIKTPDGVTTKFLCSAEQNGKNWVGAQIVLNPT